MFKNPIKKYQQGGSTPSKQERQQVMAAFQSVADKLQVPVENLVQKIQEAPDENERNARIEAVASASQGNNEALKIVASWFTQSSKLGGKIQDFICKHAKGGAIANCGCGKNIPKAEMGVVIRRKNPYENYYQFAQDTTYTGLDGKPIESTIIVNPENQEAIRQTISGNDTITAPGYFLDGKFINEGDDTASNKLVRDHINWLRKRTNSTQSQENGGVVKAQNSVPDGLPEPKLGINSNEISYSSNPYATEGRTHEMILTPQGHVTLLTTPSKTVGERADSLFLVRPENGEGTEANRQYTSFLKYKDNNYYPKGNGGNFNAIRNWWEYYKAHAGNKINY